jgi:hypothetical protein
LGAEIALLLTHTQNNLKLNTQTGSNMQTKLLSLCLMRIVENIVVSKSNIISLIIGEFFSRNTNSCRSNNVDFVHASIPFVKKLAKLIVPWLRTPLMNKVTYNRKLNNLVPSIHLIFRYKISHVKLIWTFINYCKFGKRNLRKNSLPYQDAKCSAVIKYFLQRIGKAVNNWRKHGDLSSHTLESKIKCIGGANVIEASQFDNLQALLKEVNKIWQ